MNDYNTLQNIDLSAIEAKRIRTIGYKNDGNTPCKHYYDAHPLDKVLEDTSLQGTLSCTDRKTISGWRHRLQWRFLYGV